MEDGESVLLLPECEAFVQSLQTTSLDDFGSSRWAAQHQFLEKLNMQAILNAQTHADPFVKDALVLQNKVPGLVEQLIAIELWKEKVFPLIAKSDFSPSQTFPIVMVLHHEATIVNLLETILFYKDTCECCGDVVLDLVDYCYRKLTTLVARHEAGELATLLETTTSGKAVADRSSIEEVKFQEEKLQFDISVKCLSILRYIVEHRDAISLSALTRILNVHDVPCLMIQLIEQPPWRYRSAGVVKKFDQGQWHAVLPADLHKLTKTEGQVWIALHLLLMDGESQRRYNFTDHNKNVLLRLRAHMPDILLDQLPFLTDMKVFLERLAVSEPPAVSSSFILEQIPEVRQHLVEKFKGAWKQIAAMQSEKYFDPSPEEMKQMADRWCSTYDFKALDRLAVTEKPKCALCGAEATKRCSKCQMEWYCKRECQVKHWKKHKPACSLMSQATL